ncbi:MAG: PEP-CTERM sorting domain-containing protein [Rubrivivax sp.]|nr:PEP-CTERM sorting domain-containing protein [Rubrivivax sp.]
MHTPRSLRSHTLLAVAALALAAGAQAADYTVYATPAAWQAAVGGPVLMEDFDGYASGTFMSGVEFLPGVSATTSAAPLRVVANYQGEKFLFHFGSVDMGEVVHYDVTLTLPYRAVALDIAAFEADPGQPSSAAGPGVLTVTFADATTAQFDIAGNPTGSPVFFGITASHSITGMRWTEPLEYDGYSEETGLDNFRVAAVPEPASLAMGLLGLGVLALRLRRR